MRKTFFVQTTSWVLVGLLSGCFPSFWSNRSNEATTAKITQQGGVQILQQGDVTTIQRLNPVLVGQVNLGAGDRQVQATLGEVVNNATVAIIDPASNTTIATSLTDSAGYFSIPLPTSWNPAQGSNYIVEAFKGLGNNAAGQNIIRLRSLIQKLSGQGNFTSITGTDSIGVNPMTTAVYLKSLSGFGTIPLVNTYYADNRGTVTPGGALRQVNQFTTWNVSDTQLTNLSTMVSDSVTGNQDPLNIVNASLAPVVNSFSTYTATVGSLIAINGSGFSPIPSGNTVTFNAGVPATVLYASKNQLIVAVPAGASTGNVTIATQIGTSAGINFTVSPPVGSPTGAPVIANLNNAQVSPGATVAIGGVNFVNGTNTVTFSAGSGTVTANATYVSANQVTVTVPASAKSGPVTLTNTNGTSNGYWLEVVHGSGTLVETFADNSRNDTTATNLGQWVGGASPVGAGTTLASTIADFDALTQNGTSYVYDNKDPNYPATIQLAYKDDAPSFPISNNTAMRTDMYNASYGPATYLLATNGQQIYRGDTAATPVMALHSTGFDGLPFSMRNPAINVTGFGASANYKMAGLVGSSNYFYLDETTPSFFGLSYTNVSNPFSPSTGTTAFYSTDGSSALGIYKIDPTVIGSSIYGSKLGSDGTYLYLLSGVGYVAGVPTFTQPINLYKFRPDSYTNPTRLILVNIFQNVVLPANRYLTQYTNLMVDRMAWYVPANAGGYPAGMTAYSLRTGANKNVNVLFRSNDGQQGEVCYDSLNDVYYGGTYATSNWWRQIVPNKTFESSGTVTTAVQTLPANTAWSQVALVNDPLPSGTGLKVDILDAAGNPLTPYQNLQPGASLRGLATANIKIRVTLTGNGSNTPVVRAVRLLTIPTSPVARSTGIPITGADNNDRVVIDSVQYTHTLNGGSIAYQFADSADNVSYGAFQDSFTAVSRRYLKWQIIPSVATSTDSVMVPPIVRRIQINYHY